MNEHAGSLAPRAMPIAWRLATVADIVQETSRTRTLVLDVPGWYTKPRNKRKRAWRSGWKETARRLKPPRYRAVW